MNNYKELAKSYLKNWIEIQQKGIVDYPDEWEIAEEIVKKDFHEGFRMVVELINIADSIKDEDTKYKWVYYIAAAGYEELVSEHGEELINEIIDQMNKNELFLIASTGVWPLGRDTNDKIWKIFQANIKLAIEKNKNVRVLLKRIN